MIQLRLHKPIRLVCVLVFIFISLTSCQRRSKGIIDEEFYSNGNLRNLAVSRSDGSIQIISFDSIGNCSGFKISKAKEMNGEQLWFHQNGSLKQKAGYLNGKPDGFLHEFYSSGALKNSRYLKNGLEQEFGIEYYDSEFGIAKATYYYNKRGEIYFKQMFDSSGKFLAEEGNKPEFLK